jgi:hypothetical protein
VVRPISLVIPARLKFFLAARWCVLLASRSAARGPPHLAVPVSLRNRQAGIS